MPEKYILAKEKLVILWFFAHLFVNLQQKKTTKNIIIWKDTA